MNLKYNYANYSKAIVPLVLALGRLLQGWVETGGLERSEISDVIGLAVVAVLVFLMPNRHPRGDDGETAEQPVVRRKRKEPA